MLVAATSKCVRLTTHRSASTPATVPINPEDIFIPSAPLAVFDDELEDDEGVLLAAAAAAVAVPVLAEAAALAVDAPPVTWTQF